MNAAAKTIRTHHEKASALYLEIQNAVDALAKCGDLRQRNDMAEQIRCKLSDYSYQRFAAGRDAEQPSQA